MTRCDCGRRMWLQILRSAAGYYLGYLCPNCGPWSRETWYVQTEDEAKRLYKSYFEMRYFETTW